MGSEMCIRDSYGAVEPALLTLALRVLEDCPRREEGGEIAMVDCYAVARKSREMVESYLAEEPGFKARVEIRDDLPPGLMVTGEKLLISRHTVMEQRRVEALLSHEIGVHLLTYFIRHMVLPKDTALSTPVVPAFFAPVRSRDAARPRKRKSPTGRS